MSRLQTSWCSIAVITVASICVFAEVDMSPLSQPPEQIYYLAGGVQYFAPEIEFELQDMSAQDAGPSVSLALDQSGTPTADFDFDIWCEHCLGPRPSR